MGTFYLELLARFELATRFPRNRGFVEALRPRIQILSAYADRADEAASFRMEDKKMTKAKEPRSFFGAASQIRTGDLILTKDALYRLSYSSIFDSS